MAMVTMYGRGATTFTAEKTEYRAVNGVLVIPSEMMPRAMAAGFSTAKPGWMAEQEEKAAAAAAPVTVSAPLPEEHPEAQAQREREERLKRLADAASVEQAEAEGASA